MKEPSFVYHFKPKGMVGKILFPLNELGNNHPQAHREQLKKYEGRESLLNKKIPLLNGLWNDVLHLSPINPQILVDFWREQKWLDSQKKDLPREFYKIPVEALNSESTVCYQSSNVNFNNPDPSLEKFWRFDSNQFVEHKQIEPLQIKVWEEDHSDGRPFYWYSHTMHLLAKQSINIENVEVHICK
ncbi:hypothetical protein GW916_04655 [bacterium]|nr:hypothetical protein [bacterium]